MEPGRPDVRTVLRAARARLTAAGVSSPDLDAALLLAETLGVRRERLALDPDRLLGDEDTLRFQGLVALRAERRPMAQILGRAEFWSLEFKVTKDTLSPRPETEMLVEEAVKALRGVASPVVVDIGTGTGCIAIAIAKEVPSATVHAVDLSPAALDVARENVRRHGVESRVRLHLGDMFAPLAGVVAQGSVDVVVSNPPYVRRDEEFEPEILFEPAMALFVEDVPGIYRLIADAAAAFVRPGGTLLMELPGPGSEPVLNLLRTRTSWATHDVHADGAGLARVFSATRVGTDVPDVPRAHLVFRESVLTLLKRPDLDWREIQGTYADYKASLGPWTLEQILDYFPNDYGDDDSNWPLRRQTISQFMQAREAVELSSS